MNPQMDDPDPNIPVPYTPKHPAQIKPPYVARQSRRTTRRCPVSLLDDGQLHSPRLRPALLQEPPARAHQRVAPLASLPGPTLHQSTISRPPIVAHTNYSRSQRADMNWNSTVPPQQKFGSSPNFTTFGSGIANFRPQAQPVRTAYDDFIRQVQTSLPGINVNELLNQLVTNPSQPIRLSAPSGIDTASIQSQLQSSLENTIFSMMNANRLAAPQPMLNNNPAFTNGVPHFTPANQLIGHKSVAYPIPHLPHHDPRIVLPVAPPAPSEDEMAKQDVDADADNDEEYHEVETYSEYHPAKLDIGKPHPDPVVETSSLSTVEPPDITYKLKLPSKVIDSGNLSALQLESVIYACQQHSQISYDDKTRRGFLIGDGAGVGKGRTIAGIIYENYLCGRKKSIWFSVSTDLKFDAERDLKDIGAKIPVYLLNKFPYGKRINVESGVVFTTYSGLVSKSQSIGGFQGSRMGQLTSWLGQDFDGVIVFDECHKAKNISISNKKGKSKQTKAAEAAVAIQNKLPKARVVYASATGASETRHLGYMTRLGIWGKGTPYVTFSDFCDAINKRGVGAMELVAVDLKMRGSYIARQLSFKTTSFEICTASLSEDFSRLYDECVDMWARALELFSEAADYIAHDKKRTRTIWTSFWAAHQKFFKYLCIGSKVPIVVDIAKQALEEDKCVVIGLQSTGEAKTMEAVEEGDVSEFVSTAKATFESLVDNHFPAPYKRVKSASPLNIVEELHASEINAKSPSNASSSSSTIDENWYMKDNVKFIKSHDGKFLAQLDISKKDVSKSASSKTPANKRDTNIFKKNQAALDELSKEKVNRQVSSRDMRAKRRELARKAKQTRIKKNICDSDTDISNPMSSCSSVTSNNKDTAESNSDDSYHASDDDNISESESSTTIVGTTSGSDNELSIGADKRKSTSGERSKNTTLESDSDSDVQITAVKPRRPPEVIFVSDDESDLTESDTRSNPVFKYGAKLTEMRDELIRIVERIGSRLPNNTLDDLIDQLGGPTKVAEMTGRKGRMIKDEDGQVSFRTRNEEESLDDMNIAEKERFMQGKKLIAIISEAASSGISLQADKRVKNQKRRVHITIELPWSADRAIQQFGRTHRSNQVSGPEYVFVISELAGERRFASTVAKRLESLGALTHGDRRATTDIRDLGQFNISSRYAKQAIELLCRLLERNIDFAEIKPDYRHGNFIQDARKAFVGCGLGRIVRVGQVESFSVESSSIQVNHFLNRLLGMKVNIQNAIFKLFTDYTDRLIARKKVAGQFDAGILELNSESGKTQCGKPEDYYLKTKSDIVRCTLRNIRVERGVSWEEALKLNEEGRKLDPRSGFYTSTNPLTGAQMVYLLVKEAYFADKFRAYKPNTGRQPKSEYYSILTEKGRHASLEEAEKIWRYVYAFTDKKCIHLCFFKSCKRIEAKMRCDVGLRHRSYCILSGGILVAWPYLESKASSATSKLQIVRLKLDAHNRVIGPIISQDQLDLVRRVLKEGEKGVEF